MRSSTGTPAPSLRALFSASARAQAQITGRSPSVVHKQQRTRKVPGALSRRFGAQIKAEAWIEARHLRRLSSGQSGEAYFSSLRRRVLPRSTPVRKCCPSCLQAACDSLHAEGLEHIPGRRSVPERQLFGCTLLERISMVHALLRLCNVTQSSPTPHLPLPAPVLSQAGDSQPDVAPASPDATGAASTVAGLLQQAQGSFR